MALPPHSNGPNSHRSDPDYWEVCNDNGFVYKRRRRQLHQIPSTVTTTDAELRHRSRHRKKKALLSLKQNYSQELHHWETLSSSTSPAVASVVNVGPTSTSFPAPPLLPLAPLKQQPLVDELLLQAEAQEAILKKLWEMCDYAESVCEAEEERFVEELLDLPIWGSPRALLASLQSR